MANKKQDSRELAYILFTSTDLNQKEIAERVKVSERTLTRWKTEGEWELLKAADTVTRGNQIKDMLMQLAEINKVIKDRPAGQRYANSKESDTIKKITSAIRDLDKQVTLSEYVQVFEQFINWLKNIDLKAAQDIVDYQFEFLQIKAQELNK